MTRWLVALLMMTSLAALADEAPIRTIEQLKGFLLRHPEIRHLEDALPYFAPEILSRNETLYQTGSQQEASLDYPRVLYFPPKPIEGKRLVLAMNGHPSQRNYDLLEIIEFDEKSGTFTTFSHRFPGDSERREAYLKAHGRQDSQAASLDCRSCHRQDLRYNWDDYSILPGVFDANSPRSEVAKAEASLKERLGKDPRYKFVFSGQRGSFGDVATQDNYRWILRLMKANPGFERFKYALLGAAGGCEDIEEFVPFPAKYSALRSYAQMLADTRTRGEKHIAEKLKRENADPKYRRARRGDDDRPITLTDYSEASSWPGVAALRFVAQWMRLDMEDWSLVRKPGSFAMRAAGNTFVPAHQYYDGQPDPKLPDLNKAVPVPMYKDRFFAQLANAAGAQALAYHRDTPEPYRSATGLPDPGPDFTGYVDCGSLKAKSRETLRGWVPPRPGAESPSAARSH